MSNLATNLKDTAGQYPGRPVVRLGEVVLSYADLDELSARVAGGLLAHGVRPGDRVGILLPNVLAFPVLYYGALRIGAAMVAADPGLDARAARRCLDDCPIPAPADRPADGRCAGRRTRRPGRPGSPDHPAATDQPRANSLLRPGVGWR